jgi:hypothetical protein
MSRIVIDVSDVDTMEIVFRGGAVTSLRKTVGDDKMATRPDSYIRICWAIYVAPFMGHGVYIRAIYIHIYLPIAWPILGPRISHI